MKILLMALLILQTTFCFAEEKQENKEKEIYFSDNPSDEDFDYPIVTDDNYPFLLERDNFQDPKED